MVTGPPVPFDPATVPAGHLLYRVLSASRTATDFNRGIGAPTRFGFFGDPVVPIMYAADTEEAAIAETLLHDIPADGGILPYDQYAGTVLVRLVVTRDLRVWVLHSLGLRRLKVTAEDVTASPPRLTARQCGGRKRRTRLGWTAWCGFRRKCNLKLIEPRRMSSSATGAPRKWGPSPRTPPTRACSPARPTSCG